MSFISVRNLTKVYNKKVPQFWLKSLIHPKYVSFKAVDSLSFEIEEGEIFGLLGPNGAGKTTTIQLMCGLLFPTKGSVLIDGLPLNSNFRKLSNRFNVLFADKMLYNRLTGKDNLVYYGNLYTVPDPQKRANELLELMELTQWKDSYVEHYSLGMRMKLALARALINDPEILYLDEPTLGLDVRNAEFVRNLLKKLNRTLVLTTHYLNEAIALCDRIGILKKGKIEYLDSPSNLKKRYARTRTFLLDTDNNDAVKEILQTNPYIEEIKEKNMKLEIVIKNCDNYFEVLSDISDFKLFEFSEQKT